MTELFELNTDEVVAGKGLELFDKFWSDEMRAEHIDDYLTQLEAARAQVYGE
ncbi:MAG: hypothetical protein P8183_17115 [Anaerolineae bacterium]